MDVITSHHVPTRPLALAASRTALYPATVLMVERASMRCARVIRGIISIAKAVIFRFASLFMISRLAKGCKRPIRIAPSSFVLSPS